MERSRLLLPWFVNGTLPEPQRREIEAEIERSPALRAEVEWLRAVRRAVREGPGLR